MKWLYTEFPLPFMPFPTIVRLGAQPFADARTSWRRYANGDFAGVNVDLNFTPQREGPPHVRRPRGEPHRAAAAPRLRPRRRLGDHRERRGRRRSRGSTSSPIYSFVSRDGARRRAPSRTRRRRHRRRPDRFTRARLGGVGGLGLLRGPPHHRRRRPVAVRPVLARPDASSTSSAPATPTTRSAPRIIVERSRHRGRHQRVLRRRDRRLAHRPPAPRGPGHVYTSGNRPEGPAQRDVNYYQPLDTDTGFWGAGWGEIFSLGIDYFNGSPEGPRQRSIGLDRYGRQQFALRAIYSVTPDLRRARRGLTRAGRLAPSTPTGPRRSPAARARRRP